jgi:hypothetical protein
MMTVNYTFGSWYKTLHAQESGTNPTRPGSWYKPYMARNQRTGTYTPRNAAKCWTIITRRQNHEKIASPREMQSSSIAHIGIGSPLEDDNTTSTALIFVALSLILGVFDLSQS